MAVKIILKNSSAEDKRPTPAQLENGEIALNYNEAGAFLTCKDTDGNIQQVGGVKIAETAPDSPVKQTLWFQPSSLTLFVYDGNSFLPIAGGGDGGGGTPGGGITTVIGNNGIDANEVAGVVTLDVELHGGDDGLEFRDSKLKASVASASQLGSVKIGDGIDVDSTGTISVDIPQALNFKGPVDLNNPPAGQINPNPPEVGDTYVNSALANPVDNGWTGVGGEVSQAGDLVVWDGSEWEIIATGGTPDVDLGYTAAPNNGTVTNTAGNDAVIPIADDTNAGLFTAAEKTKLENIETGANVGITEITAGDGIDISGTENTIAVDIAADAGLAFNASGELECTITGGGGVDTINLGYTEAVNQGTVTQDTGGTDAIIPLARVADPAALPNPITATAGLFSPEEKEKLAGIEDGANSGMTEVNLGYTPAVDQGTITNDSAGTDAVIPLADDTNAGLFTAAEKTKLDGIEAGATNEGTNDGRYLRIDDNGGTALDQTVQSTGTTTFSGVTDHASGINVTGVNSSVQNGLVSNGTSLNFYANSEDRGAFVPKEGLTLTFAKDLKQNFGEVVKLGGLVSRTQDGNSDLNKACSISIIPNFSGTVNLPAFGFSHYKAAIVTGVDNDISNVASISGYFAQNSIGARGSLLNYGFLSDLEQTADDETEGKNNYNFYADGTAPNFFLGDTYIGGNTTRNTRELWESTLTEEQKEELAAGTLVVPANVALPGDGEFARQWWYDQQSAENQALIDAGELDYPEHLQAENFVDTFALGDNTRINLSSTGSVTCGSLALKNTSAEFPRTGITLGSAGSENPFTKLRVLCDNASVAQFNSNGSLTVGFNGIKNGLNPLVIRMGGSGTDGIAEEGDNNFISWVATNAVGDSKNVGRFGPVIVNNVAGGNDDPGCKFSFLVSAGPGDNPGLTEKANISEVGDGVFAGGVSGGGVESPNWTIASDGTATGITVTRAAVTTDEQAGTVETLLDIITDLRARVQALEAAATA